VRSTSAPPSAWPICSAITFGWHAGAGAAIISDAPVWRKSWKVIPAVVPPPLVVGLEVAESGRDSCWDEVAAVEAAAVERPPRLRREQQPTVIRRPRTTVQSSPAAVIIAAAVRACSGSTERTSSPQPAPLAPNHSGAAASWRRRLG
jgi:hypothetical protein